eukprot:401278_1
MLIHISLRQLLLYQMGFLLFNDLKQNKTDNKIMERLKIVQTAFEQLKSYEHNTHFHEMIEKFDFDLNEEELKELDALNNSSNKNTFENETIRIRYLHPFGFGMWLQEQSFIDLNWTGTMEDQNMIKKYWQQLTGNYLIKSWKKQKINKQNIIEYDNTLPYIDISIPNNSVVKACEFRISLCNNRIFQINISKDISIARTNSINVFDTIINKNTLRIACCILFEPQLANNILKEFICNSKFNINGKHKYMDMDMDINMNTLGIPNVENGNEEDTPSYVESYIGSIATTNCTINTAYIGSNNLQIDMNIIEISKYLLEMDYSDKKNPVKYEWKLMVDALNALSNKIISIDDYTDNDILDMINKLNEGLKSSIHDQRSGLIKVACNVFVLLAQYRTEIFFDSEFFKFWMICLLRKCANRDRIRTLPAHNACRDILLYMLSYYINNKDNNEDFLLNKLKQMFIMFSQIWTPNNIDNTWMKQEKSITQFIKNISLMIKHTVILHQTPIQNIQNTQNIHELIQNTQNIQKYIHTPIQNENIKQIQLGAFDLFKIFQKQPHKKVRECSIHLLINLYQLDNNKTFQFAKQYFVQRELKDYLNKLNEKKILNEKHKKYLNSICKLKGTRIRITKGIKKGNKKKKKKKKKKNNN